MQLSGQSDGCAAYPAANSRHSHENCSRLSFDWQLRDLVLALEAKADSPTVNALNESSRFRIVDFFVAGQGRFLYKFEYEINLEQLSVLWRSRLGLEFDAARMVGATCRDWLPSALLKSSRRESLSAQFQFFLHAVGSFQRDGVLRDSLHAKLTEPVANMHRPTVHNGCGPFRGINDALQLWLACWWWCVRGWSIRCGDGRQFHWWRLGQITPVMNQLIRRCVSPAHPVKNPRSGFISQMGVGNNGDECRLDISTIVSPLRAFKANAPDISCLRHAFPHQEFQTNLCSDPVRIRVLTGVRHGGQFKFQKLRIFDKDNYQWSDTLICWIPADAVIGNSAVAGFCRLAPYPN